MSIEYENPWFRVVKQGQYHFVEENGSDNGAVILLQAGEYFVFVRVFRQAHNSFFIEAPRGYGEKGEVPAQTAARELFEETGYSIESNKFKHIGTIQPNSAILSSSLPIYFVSVDERINTSALDSEVSEIVYIEKDKILNSIARGEITDGITTAALAMYWASPESN